MRLIQDIRLMGLYLIMATFLTSCDTVDNYGIYKRGPGIGHGPPDHAPAHGYRHKQANGYELVFDSECGVYVVIGMDDCYFHDGYYYRLQGDVWQIGVSLNGDWHEADRHALPPGLRGKTKPKGMATAKGKSKR